MTNGQPAPGWYPDHNDPSIVRYWDGATWTAHTAPRQAAAPATQAAAAPATGGTWFARNKAASIAIGVVSVVAVLGIIGAATGSTSESDTKPAAAAVAKPTPTSPATVSESTPAAAKADVEQSESATPEPTDGETAEVEQPASPEDQFIDIIGKGHDAADSGNEIAVVQARKARGKAACALLGAGLAAKDWHGTVESVETELGGDDGVLAIAISDDIAVQTWNNGVSDIGAGTLIDPNSEVYAQLAQLEEGDDVVFSGHFVRDGGNCLQEQSLMDVNGMLTPDFSFEFSSVKPG